MTSLVPWQRVPYLPTNAESSLIGGDGADRFILRTEGVDVRTR